MCIGQVTRTESVITLLALMDFQAEGGYIAAGRVVVVMRGTIDMSDAVDLWPQFPGAVDPWSQFDAIEACQVSSGVRHVCVVVEAVGTSWRRYVRYYLRCQDVNENARTFKPDERARNQDDIVAFYADEDGVNCIACLGR